MTEKKYLSILGSCCLVLALLCMVAVLGRQSHRQEQVETVLLNKNYAPQLTQVDISDGDVAIYLHRGNLHGKFLWWGSASAGITTTDSVSRKTLIFPLDSVVMNEFLSTMEEVRSLTLVSRKRDNLSSFGLGDGQGIRVRFGLSDGSTASQITFGHRNYSGHRIYLKTPLSPVYLSQDEFYPWLSTAPKSWADMALVSQQLLGISGEGQVQRLVMNVAAENGGFHQKLLLPTQSEASSQDFSSKTSRLLSLRGGGLIHPDLVAGRPLLAEITVDTGLGSSATLRIYQGNQSRTDQEISSYYVVPQYNYLSGNDRSSGGGLSEGGLPSMSYGLEISGWTWDNILKLME